MIAILVYVKGFTVLQVCFLPGALALGATKGITKEKAMLNNLLTFEDLENLKLAEDLAKTCFEMYSVTSTGLAPEIAYFHTEVIFALKISSKQLKLSESAFFLTSPSKYFYMYFIFLLFYF